jgi:hypothetical protein
VIDLTIDKNGLDILASMKGKTLKSLEGEYFNKWHRFSEIVRFNLGQYAVEVFCDYVAVKWFWNTDKLFDDEGSAFFISKEVLNSHNYPEGWQVVQLLKDEKISEVIIVRDSIKNNHGDEILWDSGIVMRTSASVYTFSMGSIGGTTIFYKESDKIDMISSVKDIMKYCSDSEFDLKATVKRDYIFL